MRNNCCKFILLVLVFCKNFLYKKTFYFLLFLLEFDIFIVFQSRDVVHIQSRSTLDFFMIFVNDNWTPLYDLLLHLTLGKCIAHSPFSFVERTDSIEI